MKKLLLISLVLMIAFPGFAQKRFASVPKSLQDLRVPYKTAVDNNQGPVQNYNSTVSTKSVLDPTIEIIGNTFYDLQTNGCMMQRLYVTDEGKMGAAWTRGITSTSYPDRGTGYNYFDGSAWGPAPTARIEAIRTGFPSIAQWNGNGEVVVSHQSVGLMQLMTRDVAGTGSWTSTNIPKPSGAPDPLWPSMVTSGNNHQFIHIIALTTPEASGGVKYNNLDGCILYWRSSDGGATWEKTGVSFPQLTSPEYYGFEGDSYVWAQPKGDTLAFVYGDNWSEEFLMYSYDNGETWNKTVILGNQYKGTPAGTSHLPFYGADGSSSVAIDKNGVFHVSFGRMRASEDGTGRLWYPFTDGLIYWNSMMPQLQDSLDLDTLYNHGQLVAYVTGDTIVDIAYYYHSMTSYPGITVDDESGRLFIVCSGVVTENPGDVNFRHIKGIGCNDYMYNYTQPTWNDPVDFNSGIDDMYLEFIFPALAKNTTSDKIHYIVQSSDVPGCNVQVTTVPVHDNNIIYNGIDKDAVVLVNGVKNIENPVASVTNFPNPFTGSTTININMTKAGHAVLEVASITGQVVSTSDLGTLNAGNNSVSFNGSNLSSGVYIYSVKVNGVARTGRMIVR